MPLRGHTLRHVLPQRFEDIHQRTTLQKSGRERSRGLQWFSWIHAVKSRSRPIGCVWDSWDSCGASRIADRLIICRRNKIPYLLCRLFSPVFFCHGHHGHLIFQNVWQIKSPRKCPASSKRIPKDAKVNPYQQSFGGLKWGYPRII